MTYIILDMEWDSAYNPKYKRFINQILQIGAVKLNGNFDIIDTFEVTVKSSFAKKVSGRFATLTGITTQDMLSGIPLSEAVKKYNKWIGNDTITLTWSNSDLFSIKENERYLLDGVSFYMEKYLDLQSFIQNELKLLGFEINSQISLSNAAQMLGITTEGFELHTAKDDSLLCAAILKKCYFKDRFQPLVKDTANPDFYRRLFYKPHYIDDIADKDIDKAELEFSCEICGGLSKRISKWNYRNRWFSALFICKNCKKRFMGRICFKKTFDSVVVKKRVCEPKKPKEEVKNNEVQSLPSTVQ